MNLETNEILLKTEEQNKLFLDNVKLINKFQAKRIIAKYDWRNSPLDFPDEWNSEMDKVLEYTQIYLMKRANFFKFMLLYLS